MNDLRRSFVTVCLLTTLAAAGPAAAQTAVAPAGEGADAAGAAAAGDRLRAEAFCDSALGGELWARTELYFGMSRADGPDVSEQEFRRFLARVVTPRFPDGLTVLSGDGQYRGSSGVVVREPSKVLILFYPFTHARSRSVDRIRERYKADFGQESVLRVDDVSCVSF